MARTAKLDLYRKHRDEYAAVRRPALVRIRPASYLAIDGRGKAGGEEFERQIGCLYAVAFTLKMARKFAGRDYAVSKLEGLWWGGARREDGDGGRPQTWSWKLLIHTPDFIREDEVEETRRRLLDKGKDPELARVKLESLEEGLCVQALHVGPYDQEAETIAAMKALAREAGLSAHGRHHEIYLSDPRRVAPEKLRTILRQPVR